MMKKFTSYIAGALTGILLVSVPIFADSYTKTIEALVNFTTVKINGKEVQSDNFVVDGKTYVWIRDVAEMFGKQIEWNDETNTANIVNEITKVVATVDDIQITNLDLKTTSALNSNGEISAESIQIALDFEIDNAVILNRAEKSGLGLSEDLKEYAADQIAQFKEYYGDEADSILASYNLTDESYMKMIEKNMITDNFYAYSKENKAFTEQEISDKYDEMAESFITVTAKHILIGTQDKTDDEAKKQAEKIKAELKTVDMFDELMAEYSDDTGSKDDAEGMTFGKGQMVQEFETAAFTQEIGVIGEPVKTQYGYHIILVTERSTQPLDEVKEICESSLFSEWFEKQIDLWKNEIVITVFDDELNALKDSL
ncbi:MAG: peptidylprolyl isomerase [Firmicutes bacterium]|nr:peptidylprolyl isomerase [Bacillota bacterium]